MTDYKINKEYLQKALELLVKIEKAKETESAFLEKSYFYQLKGYIEGGIEFLEMTEKIIIKNKTMQKFKIDDKVKIKYANVCEKEWWQRARKDFPNMTGIIKNVCKDYYNVCGDNKNWWYFNEQDLELWEEEKLICDIQHQKLLAEKARNEKILSGFYIGNKTFTAVQDIKKGQQVEIIDGKLYPVLTEERKKEIIKGCLQYAIHRMRKHILSGADGICNVETIERILEELK